MRTSHVRSGPSVRHPFWRINLPPYITHAAHSRCLAPVVVTSLLFALSGCGGSSTDQDIGALAYSPRCSLPAPDGESYRVSVPTGTSCVGTASAFVSDAARKDGYAPDPDSARSVQLRAWYPASSVDNLARAPYASDISYQTLQWPDAQRKPTGNSFLNAPVTQGAKYPVLLFSPGFGIPAALYTGMAEDLASHGYIVVAIEHPYFTGPVAYPDGHVALPLDETRVTEQDVPNIAAIMTEDQRFTLTWLQQHQNDRTLPFSSAMDLARVGAYGHSIGGSASLQLLRTDSRVKSAVNMDGTVWGDLAHAWTKPWMIVSGERDSDASYAIFRDNPRADSILMVKPKSGHLEFSDLPRWNAAFKKTLSPALAAEVAASLDVVNPDPDGFEDKLRQDLRAFFDRTVKQ